MKGTLPRSLYFGGGTDLKVGDAALQRSEEGLAYVEAAENGEYVLANPSPSPATVTATLKALHGLVGFDLDDDGKPKRKADGAPDGEEKIFLRLEAGARVGFFPPSRIKFWPSALRPGR